MMESHPLGFCLYYQKIVETIPISSYTFDLLLNIVGDNGENEGGDDVIKRLAMFYLERNPNKENPFLE